MSKFKTIVYLTDLEEIRRQFIKKILNQQDLSSKSFNSLIIYGYTIEIGENFYSNYNPVILDEAKVSFGNNVFIAPNCSFYRAGYPLNVTERNKGLE